MKKETIANAGLAIVIALQSWILLEIVSLRDRLTKVETKIEWWKDR